MRDRFYDTWDAARQGLLYEWRNTFEGALAEIIVLDQFSRNLNRRTMLSYTQDNMALILSQNLMQQYPDYKERSEDEITFIYLPWMHSESKEIQKETEELYLELDNEELTKYMYQHKEIIDRFGRYPYRNEILGRTSTADELDFISDNDLDFSKKLNKKFKRQGITCRFFALKLSFNDFSLKTPILHAKFIVELAL
jgi:Uncharacterized protein conserved in bacteria